MAKEREYLVDNLSLLLSSGMPIGAAIDALKIEVRSKRLRAELETLKQEVGAGSALWRALGTSRLLSPHVIALIKVGEESGRLAENLKAIAVQEEREREFRSKIRSAMLYPGIIFSLTIIIGLGIAWFILPRLAAVFTSLRVELPLPTRAMIAFGTFLGKYGALAIPGFLITLGLLFYVIFIAKFTRRLGELIILRTPGVKNLIKEAEVARFGFILGTLLMAGLPVVEALKSLSVSTTLEAYRKLITTVQVQIAEGNSFQKSFAAYPGINQLLPVPVQQLVISAERSGTLAETLLKIGAIYESKIDTSMKNISVIVEPILLVIVWLGVIGVALAVILPLYSLIGGLNR